MNIATTPLADAEQRLRTLREAEQEIRQALSAAINEASPHAMIVNRKALEKNLIYQFAAKSQVLKLQRTQTDRERQEKIVERDALEKLLVEAMKEYQLALDQLAEKQLTVNQINLKLGGLDSAIETQRLDRNETDRDLKIMIANWQDSNSFLRAPSELACDLD